MFEAPAHRDYSWPRFLICHLFCQSLPSPLPPPQLSGLWPPACLPSFHEAGTREDVPRGIHYGLHCAGPVYVRQIWQRRFHFGSLIVLIRQVCSRFIPKGFKHQSVLPRAMPSIEMCTLAPDSLLTGLPGLVKATGSFSETKACNASFHTHNKRLSSPAAIYLPFNSCRLSFLAVVFSCLPAWPSVGVEGNTWISGSAQLFRFLFFVFFLPNMPWFFDSFKDFFEASINISGSIKEPHITRGSEFNWNPLWFKRLLSPSPGMRAAELKVEDRE